MEVEHRNSSFVMGQNIWTLDIFSTAPEAMINMFSVYQLTTSTFILFLGFISFRIFGGFSQSPKLPWVNQAGFFDIFQMKAKYRFLMGAGDMILKGFKEHPDAPGFRMVADASEIIMLSPKYADELKNDHRVDFVQLFLKDFHEGIPGFEFTDKGARDAKVLREVTKSQLTHQLAKTTAALSSECTSVLKLIFTDSKEYHDKELRKSVLELVARISSRAFLGEDNDLCRNEEWLKVTMTYAGNVMGAAVMLRLWPVPLRRLVHWFIPSCGAARAQVKEARRLMDPMLERRRQAKLADPGLRYDDTVEWAEQMAKGKYYDVVSVQLLFSMAAMHTTTDLLTQVMLDLAVHTEVLEPLRQEIETVLTAEGGFSKAAFHKMRLLDSVLKECQRMKPAAVSGLRGILTENVKLSDGLLLPKGSSIAVSAHQMWDADIYSDPHVWNGWRFYELRQTPGKEHRSQLVATSPEHMGFGIGTHACPGRFFAAHEVKLALCHILLRYDWKIAEGVVPQTRTFMWSLIADPKARISIKRRRLEPRLASLIES